jgi:hypothetical protein
MSRLEKARKRQEVLMENLAVLVRKKRLLPPEREEWVRKEIEAVKNEIGKLDREIQRLMMEERFKR